MFYFCLRKISHLAVGVLCLICSAALVGCDREGAEGGPQTANKPKGVKIMKITMESKAFKQNERIPVKYTGEGEDISPPLAWSGVPENTKELALIMDDPDAPTPEPWVHWVLYKVPANTQGLPEKIVNTEKLSTPPGAMQGKTSAPKVGYHGPMPPKGHGVHHYHFKVYALNTALDLKSGLDKKGLLKAMSGHILAEGELIGTYERK
jgi:Raf kinase inhibitor-like YbhB/YbcL family protein